MYKTTTYMLITLFIVITLWSVWGFFGSRVEQADYTVVKTMKDYEIREYPEHIVAQTVVKGSHRKSLNSGFSIVAGYIFGDNTKKTKIAMTAPVIAQNSKDSSNIEKIAMTAPVVATAKGDSQVVSFFMPRSYSLESLPTPNDSRVTIVEIPKKKFAVMSYSWYNSDKRIASMQEKLLSALARDKVSVEGSVAYAGYNAPGTPPWMIRNEVLVELK
jgi:effector-binding domain-containing protein